MEKKCCICGEELKGFGNNANPIKDGICCDKCNYNFVIPGRIYNSNTKNCVSFEICKTVKQHYSLVEELKKRDFERIFKLSHIMPAYQNPETGEEVVLCLSYDEE